MCWRYYSNATKGTWLETKCCVNCNVLLISLFKSFGFSIRCFIERERERERKTERERERGGGLCFLYFTIYKMVSNTPNEI